MEQDTHILTLYAYIWVCTGYFFVNLASFISLDSYEYNNITIHFKNAFTLAARSLDQIQWKK